MGNKSFFEHEEENFSNIDEKLIELKNGSLSNAEKVTENNITESSSPNIKPGITKKYDGEMERDYELIDKVLERQQENMNTWSPYFKKMIKWQIIVIYSMVLFSGFDYIPFKINDKLIALLVTGLFAEAIGIVAIMIKYIYSNQVALLHQNRKNGNH